MPVTIKSMLQGIEVRAADGLETPVTGICYDSRQVTPGALFVCVQGFRADGHTFISDAIARGAAGIIVDKSVTLPTGMAWALVKDSRVALGRLAANFYGHPSKKLTMIGVTGTNGKTTTTHLIETLLRFKGEQTGVVGTIYNKIGDQKLPVLHTTPESSDLQQLLGKMVAFGVTAVAMEVSSHALVLHRVAECEFDVAIFTNLTQDHLDFHHDMDEYQAAKMRLFTSVGRERTKQRPCYAVINSDDPVGPMIAERCAVPVVSYGIKHQADLQATNLELSARGTSFKVRYQGREFPIRISLPGEFNVYNTLAALAVGLQEGLDLVAAQDALSQIKGVPGRFEVVNSWHDFTVIVDYAHTPDGLANVLKTARAITHGRLITVFGCGGDRDTGKRPIMGRLSGELSDYTVITSDNPRTEDPASITAQIENGIKDVSGVSYQVTADRRQAIREALHLAKPGDMVVLAGKGHEIYQIIGEESIPFDDRQVAHQIMEKEIIS